MEREEVGMHFIDKVLMWENRILFAGTGGVALGITLYTCFKAGLPREAAGLVVGASGYFFIFTTIYGARAARNLERRLKRENKI